MTNFLDSRPRAADIVAAVTLAACLAGLGGVAFAQSAESATATTPQVRNTAPPPGALVAPGDDPELTLLHTGYVVGYIEPCG